MYFIIPILLGTYRHLMLYERSLCVLCVHCLRPISFKVFFAVNLVRKTDTARAVYAAITSCVDIALRSLC